MLFIELYVPRGAIASADRERLGQRLMTELIHDDGSSGPDLIEQARSAASVVVEEVDVWVSAGRAVGPDDPTRYRARVTVPAEHLNDERRTIIVETVTRVLAEVDGDPDSLAGDWRAWVGIVEVPDGNLGAFGRVMRVDDIVGAIRTGDMPARLPVAVD